ncbi:MAG TPA: 1-phosphofructokinase family hexose kinase [Thermotoga sp.]|nr:MAG: carbohydrate kinase [Thermotogota bacterium]RKX52921.1 MAG: carbohydrate kinase [Thermotoga sp.]RKX57426.1 MAG: carbohydrate kinase [Thermotoga sp.]HDG61806.1 1-phosphofructokinase family hexose kinase [Thermotoga sp.]
MEVLTVTLNPALDREIYIDNFELNKLHRLRSLERTKMSPGGKGINVSIALAKLGIPSIAMGILGGYVGKVVLEELRKIDKRITTNFVHIDGETRENIAIIDEVNDTITEINGPGPVVSQEDIDHFLRRYKMSLSRTNCVVISGSIPIGVDEGIYAQLSGMAKERNVCIFMEATNALLTKAIKQNCPDVVKPDLRGEQIVLDQKLEEFEDYVEAAEEIVNYGARLAVLSYKIKNDIVATKEGIWLISMTVPLEESHLLGSGDAYVAGMVYHALRKKWDLLEMAKFGFSAAVAVTRKKSKEMPSIEDIEAERDSFTVERVK